MELEVRPEWIDYNGHMTDSRYLQVFGDATDALLRYAGVDDAYRKSGRALFTVESHVTHLAEARAMESLYVNSRVLELDDKRLRLFHGLHRKRDDALVATAEQLYLHVHGGKAAADGGRRCAMRSPARTQPRPPCRRPPWRAVSAAAPGAEARPGRKAHAHAEDRRPRQASR